MRDSFDDIVSIVFQQVYDNIFKRYIDLFQKRQEAHAAY